MNNIGWVPHLGLRSVRFCRNQCLQKRNAGCDDKHKSAVPRQILRCYSERWDSNILWRIYFTFIVNPLLQEFTHHRPNGMSQRKKSQVFWRCSHACTRSRGLILTSRCVCLDPPEKTTHCSSKLWWTVAGEPSPPWILFFFFFFVFFSKCHF